MITKIWLYPPFAIARVGTSSTPCPNFNWGKNDLSPRGTGKTTVVPDETLEISESGKVTKTIPTELIFKDEEGIRPVCPFFELHGEWETEEGSLESGAITTDVLTQFGKNLQDIQWTVSVANLKPFHYTLNPADKITSHLTVAGNDTQKKTLEGISESEQGEETLVPIGSFIPLGFVQVTLPTDKILRLRFTSSTGKVYGPSNLNQRQSEYSLPAEQLFLNPNASWCDFRLTDNDPRTNPGGLFAQDSQNVSVGLCDDVCDGIIKCSIGNLTASSRITVAPPDYAPDRRPFTSLADGFSDRVKREDVSDDEYFEDMELVAEELQDIFERILETMEAMNLDYQNTRARGENRALAESAGLPPIMAQDKAFPQTPAVLGQPLPLTEKGRQKHRRFISLEVMEDILREKPDLLSEFIREPMTEDRYYDQKMPPLIRGSDRYPMHITRRQYDLLSSWVKHLRIDAGGLI